MRTATDSPSKDVILKALTRLNERSTLRVAAEELSIIVRGLDQDGLGALVQSICTTTGAWEPKPVAKKECVRVLAQLPQPSCPVADVALQQLLPKILGYLKKQLQDADSVVREASSDAMAAYAQGCARLWGCAVPATTATPIVKVVFDVLAEQKKEAQMGASQALLKMSPFLGPLDKELVKVLLKLLRSPGFLGTAQLLAAIASTDAELRTPVGLLKHGASAFQPYINHLVGQSSQRRASAHQDPAGPSSGGGSTASSTITLSGKPFSASGILGCISSQDWAVRRAAADAVRALVLLVGPELEPEDCWGLGDPGSVTGRCLNALEDCRFDKVKEARETAREAAALIHQLHRFVAEQGSDGDWRTWAGNNLPYSGWQSPAPSPPHSPLAPKSPSFRQLQHMASPIAERFRRAAVDSDVIVEPGSRVLQQQDSAADGAAAAAANCTADMATTVIDASGAQRLVIEGSESHAAVPAAGSIDGEHSQRSIGAPDIVEEQSSMSVSSSVQEGRVLPKEQAQPRKLWSVDAAAPPVRRTVSSSRPSSRPGSAGTNGRQQPSSRRASAQEQQQGSVGMESSQGAVSGSVPSYAAGTRSSTARGASGAVAGARGTARQGDCPAPSSKSRPASRPQTAGVWQGPSQQEWEQVQQQLAEQQQQLADQQQQLADQQQLVAQLQQQAAATLVQHAAEVLDLKETSAAACVALQERVATLEVLVQRQQQLMQEQWQTLQQQQQPPPPSSSLITSSPLSSRRSPTRCSSSPSASAGMAAAAAIAANSPVGGVLNRDAILQQHSILSEGPPSGNRLYKSAEWGGLQGCSSGRKGLVTPIDPLAVGRRSFNCLTPGSSASGGLRSCESAAVTPGDLEAAYADAVRNERGSVHLMRLTQKTGPVWGQLSTQTCHALLEVFIKHVRDGVMLHRVLPWLWRLADEDAGRPDVPEALQQQLLEALECCPAAEDLQAQERVCLLLDTLKAVWTH